MSGRGVPQPGVALCCLKIHLGGNPAGVARERGDRAFRLCTSAGRALKPDDRREPLRDIQCQCDADDGAVSGDQGGAFRCPAVLPDGRFLRAVLRRCGGGECGARHRAHETRQASGRGYPDVRRAGACGGRLSADADPQGVPGGGLRADRGSGGGEEARLEIGGAARGGAAGDARHADRGQPARSPAPQLSCGLFGNSGERRLRLGGCLDRRFHGDALSAPTARADAGPAGAARGAGGGDAGSRVARSGH